MENLQSTNTSPISAKKIAFYCVSGVIGVVLLPLLWFLFSNQGDLFEFTISDVAGRFGFYWQFVALAAVTTVYCIAGGLFALKKCGYTDKIATGIALFGIALFFVTCLVPYDKNQLGSLIDLNDPRLAEIYSDIHDVMVRGAIAIIVTVLFYFQIMLIFKKRTMGIVSVATLALLATASVTLIVLFGISALMEALLLCYLSSYIFVVPFVLWLEEVFAYRKQIVCPQNT